MYRNKNIRTELTIRRDLREMFLALFLKSVF